MKELEFNKLIEPGCVVSMYIEGKKYISDVVETDGSYVNVYFGCSFVTIPRVYTKQITEPDEYDVYFKVFTL